MNTCEKCQSFYEVKSSTGVVTTCMARTNPPVRVMPDDKACKEYKAGHYAAEPVVAKKTRKPRAKKEA